jgi:hypothetical protein
MMTLWLGFPKPASPKASLNNEVDIEFRYKLQFLDLKQYGSAEKCFSQAKSAASFFFNGLKK